MIINKIKLTIINKIKTFIGNNFFSLEFFEDLWSTTFISCFNSLHMFILRGRTRFKFIIWLLIKIDNIIYYYKEFVNSLLDIFFCFNDSNFDNNTYFELYNKFIETKEITIIFWVLNNPITPLAYYTRKFLIKKLYGKSI